MDRYPYDANGNLLPNLEVVDGKIVAKVPAEEAPAPEAPTPSAPETPEADAEGSHND